MKSYEALISEARQHTGDVFSDTKSLVLRDFAHDSVIIIDRLAEALRECEVERDGLDAALKFSWETREEQDDKWAMRLQKDPTGIARLMAEHFLDVLERPAVSLDPANPGPALLDPGYAPMDPEVAAAPVPNYVEMTFRHATRGQVVVTVQRVGGKTPHQLRREADAEVVRLRDEVEHSAARTCTWVQVVKDRDAEVGRLRSALETVGQEWDRGADHGDGCDCSECSS